MKACSRRKGLGVERSTRNFGAFSVLVRRCFGAVALGDARGLRARGRRGVQGTDEHIQGPFRIEPMPMRNRPRFGAKAGSGAPCKAPAVWEGGSPATVAVGCAAA